MDNDNKRSAYWDNIKGILIFLTVFAHILYSYQYSSDIINSITDYIYMFHMPAFVFVSGYFGKSPKSRSVRAILKLLFLFFVFNSIMGFIYGFRSPLIPVYSYWYIIALIVWRLTAVYISRFNKITYILILVSLLAGFYANIDNTLAIARIIGFYPFYMAGYLLDSQYVESLKSKVRYKRIGNSIIVLIWTMFIACIAYYFFQYTDEALQMGSYTSMTDLYGRIFLYVIASLAIFILLNLTPDKKIMFLTMFGRNSLWIYIFHRHYTLMYYDFFDAGNTAVTLVSAFIAATIICLIFGNDYVSGFINRFADSGVEMLINPGDGRLNLAKIAVFAVSIGLIVETVFNAYPNGYIDNTYYEDGNDEDIDDNINENNSEIIDDVKYSIMDEKQKAYFDNAYRITFAGDLIALEDQVKRAYDGEKYDFSEVFEYSKKYIDSADYAIGVFEGPMAGEDASYTTSNFDDGKELHLNFPDTFAEAVKEAGFDLVTTANNHLLDKGEKGALRTIEVLDRVGLDHTGSYKSLQDKSDNRVKYVEHDGLSMAILSYTYGSNYYDNSILIDGSLSYITSVISGTSGERFEKLKSDVCEDFKAAKALNPDLIIVLPHIGTQFSNMPDEEQRVWFDIFKENGADIILGDHPHVVEPTYIEEYNGKNVFKTYCPGNFANIYRKQQGDTSILVDVYIDKVTKKVIGGGIVPLYTQASADGNYRALPIYEINNNSLLRKQLSTDDVTRAENANDIITKVIFGHAMDISSVTERYYFNKDGFLRQKTTGLVLNDEMRSSRIYKALMKADSICFIGDSVTEGTKNGGCPWYEPLEEYLTGKTIYNFSKGGCTVSYINSGIDNIPEADLYIVAIGTNDVRYRDETICAMTKTAYVNEINKLKTGLSNKSPSSEFVFIAPWYSTDGDIYCNLTYEEKTALNNEYSDELKNYCDENELIYINANDHIKKMLNVNPDKTFLLDHIHPNSSQGVVMYCEAVLQSDD